MTRKGTTVSEQRKSRALAPRRGEPILGWGDRMGAQASLYIDRLLREAGGEFLLIRKYRDRSSAAVSATRVRDLLGPNFYVEVRNKGEIWARARRIGEPVVYKRKVKVSEEWISVKHAAERLEITTQWLRTNLVNRGFLRKYVFQGRVVFKREDVERLHAQKFNGKVGGAWLTDGREKLSTTSSLDETAPTG